MNYKMSNGEKPKRANCLICGGQISSSNYGVFCTVVPNTDTLLASAVEKIICKKLVPSVLSAASICARCFSLFEELACAESKCASIKKKILTFFEKNSHRIKNGIREIEGVGCQTEDVLDINNVIEKPDHKLKEEECETENACDKSATEKKTDTGKVTARTSVVEVGKSGAYSKRKGRPARKTHTAKQNSNKLSNGQEKDIHRVRRYIHPCSLCGRLFRRPCEVKQHLLSHGGAKPYQCRDCGKKFGSKSGAGIHALKKHGKDISEENIIDLCKDGTFINSSSDQINMMVERDNKVKKEIDDNRGNDTSSDDDFEWKMDEEEIFGMFNSEEQKFDSVTNSPDKATSSETEQNGTGSVKNEDAEKDITVDENKEEEAKLSDTGKTSPSKQESKNHEESNDSKDDKRTRKEKKRKREPVPKVPKHECGICGKKWRTMSEYRTHVATHNDERPYICEICGQAYKHKPALDIHVGMHNGINPFCCPYCNKAFTQKGALQRHMPIHTGEAPFQCELCGKRFVHHTSFNMHTLAHTGQKSYKCGLCGLALLSGSHLKRHSRVHTGERPYQCQTCGKRFAERYNLVAHTRVHDTSSNSGARDGGYKKHHRCQLCGARFDRRPKLDHHMALCHNKLGESEDNQKWIGHTMTEESSKQTASDLGTVIPAVTLSQPHMHSVAPTSAHQHRPLLLHTVHGQTHGSEHDQSHTHGSKVAGAHSHGHPHAHPLLAAAAAHQTLSVPNQHQQNWHQIIFGGNGVRAEDGAGNLLDGVPPVKVGMQGAGMNGTAQHRLLTEMPSLGHSTQNHSVGVTLGTGRNVLASCLAAAAPHHLVPNNHAPHLTNHHSVTQSRVNMFSSGES